MIEKAEYSIGKKITGHDILSVNYAVGIGRHLVDFKVSKQIKGKDKKSHKMKVKNKKLYYIADFKVS